MTSISFFSRAFAKKGPSFVTPSFLWVQPDLCVYEAVTLLIGVDKRRGNETIHRLSLHLTLEPHCLLFKWLKQSIDVVWWLEPALFVLKSKCWTGRSIQNIQYVQLEQRKGTEKLIIVHLHQNGDITK